MILDAQRTLQSYCVGVQRFERGGDGRAPTADTVGTNMLPYLFKILSPPTRMRPAIAAEPVNIEIGRLQHLVDAAVQGKSSTPTWILLWNSTAQSHCLLEPFLQALLLPVSALEIMDPEMTMW
jgi:hypothetical protein